MFLPLNELQKTLWVLELWGISGLWITYCESYFFPTKQPRSVFVFSESPSVPGSRVLWSGALRLQVAAGLGSLSNALRAFLAPLPDTPCPARGWSWATACHFLLSCLAGQGRRRI